MTVPSLKDIDPRVYLMALEDEEYYAQRSIGLGYGCITDSYRISGALDMQNSTAEFEPRCDCQTALRAWYYQIHRD